MVGLLMRRRDDLTWKAVIWAATIAALGWMTPFEAEAQPSPPATFSGSATVDGKAPADGTTVRAFIEGHDCTQPGAAGMVRQGTSALYRIEVLADSQMPGCGSEGRLVTFAVGGQPASENGTWRSVPQTLNLTASTATTTATATPPAAAPTIPNGMLASGAATASVVATSPAPTSPTPLVMVGSGTPEGGLLNPDSPGTESGGERGLSKFDALAAASVGGFFVTACLGWAWTRHRRPGPGPRSD